MRNDNASDDEAVFGNGGVGAAPEMSTLATHVPTATMGPQNFDLPTTPQPNAAMGCSPDPELLGILCSKRKKATANPELQVQQTGAAATTTTLVAGTYYIFRIDCTTQSNIKFYINGTRVAASTTFNNAASAANSKCQPHFGLYKASGAGLGVLSVDYVKIWSERS